METSIEHLLFCSTFPMTCNFAIDSPNPEKPFRVSNFLRGAHDMVVPHRFSAWGRLQLPKRDGFAHQLVSARKCLAQGSTGGERWLLARGRDGERFIPRWRYSSVFVAIPGLTL